MKKTALLALLLLNCICVAQEYTQRIKDYSDKFTLYGDTGKYDSIVYISNRMLLNTDLNNYEKQVIFYSLGVKEQYVQRYEEAIDKLKESLTFCTGSKFSIRFRGYTNYVLADVYFTKQQYKKAFIYAERSINDLDSKRFPGNFITLHSIVAYYYYLTLEYDKSLKEYDLVEKIAIAEVPCKVAEIIMNKAKVLSKLKKYYEAKKNIDRAIQISDSCGEQNNKLNALKSLREILVENGKHEEANKLYYKIEHLSADYIIDKRNEKVDSLETIYKTKQKEAQNKMLQKENDLKEKVNKTQEIVIIATLLGLLILCLLLFYVYKLTKKEKQTNLLLSEKKAALERMNLLNQKIFTVISHDFKDPMLSLEVLLKSNFSDTTESGKFNKNKELISNKLGQANLIMNNLLNWAKSELQIIPNKDNFSDVFIVAQNTILQLQPLLDNKNITVKNIIPAQNKTTISDDLLMIILRNLLNNAIKYSYEDNDIIIGFNEKTNEYYVQDFGTGITKEYLENLFQTELPSKIGTNQETGFGLGLQFVNEILKQNNGILRIESEIHEGSVFYFAVN
jgi:signal transduction histidine kinase